VFGACVQVVGTENEDMPQFKLMLNGMLRCPVTIESLSHVVRSGEELGKLDVFYGRNSFRENAIKAKVKHTTSSSFIQTLEYGNTSPLSRITETVSFTSRNILVKNRPTAITQVF